MPELRTKDGRRLTEQDTRSALRDHAAHRGREARAAYGPAIDCAAMFRMLADRSVVRYPTTIVFDAAPLDPGEFAYPELSTDADDASYRLYVHPCFRDREDALPPLIAYQLVRINYGDVATHEDAEAFGAALLGMNVDEYYERVCALADAIPSPG